MMLLTMNLDKSLIKFQRIIARAWDIQALENKENSLSYSEFEYLLCVYTAENSEIDTDSTDHDDSAHLSVLAAEMQVQKSSASLMINKLEKRGLIYRATCQYDARAQHILLTELGRKLFLKAQNTVYKSLEQSFKTLLDDEEYNNFEKALTKLCSAYHSDC
ncbi:MarR family winged helix-turn-helix transcriptional regulator [Flocculibacter collagenilyticus]|uniref:MarR family winged helix-turn-helix transcriptional regulator n=1 Tax=Flocculibacter collagenilyticus TaxID=2744479 RepID=UPI0018F489D9|nr:MarR family transcriptional regulator [Flocculibacter collagenilyticus]